MGLRYRFSIQFSLGPYNLWTISPSSFTLTSSCTPKTSVTTEWSVSSARELLRNTEKNLWSFVTRIWAGSPFLVWAKQHSIKIFRSLWYLLQLWGDPNKSTSSTNAASCSSSSCVTAMAVWRLTPIFLKMSFTSSSLTTELSFLTSPRPIVLKSLIQSKDLNCINKCLLPHYLHTRLNKHYLGGTWELHLHCWCYPQLAPSTTCFSGPFRH